MKTRSLALFSLIVFLFSCAGGPGVLDEAPEWIARPMSETEDQLVFRGTGDGETLAAARSAAIDELSAAVLEAMDLGDPDFWGTDGTRAVDAFLEELDQVVRTPEYNGLEGLIVANRDGWSNDAGRVSYGVEILWDRDDFAVRAEELADVVGIASPEFRELEKRARAAETAGNTYEAALLWAAASGLAEENGNLSGYRLALRNIESILEGFDYAVVSVPTAAYVGSRPSDPVLFMVTSRGKAVGNAEFIITYPRLNRDGSPARGSARIASDYDGYVRFRPPETAFAGTQEVTIAPSAAPFLEYADDTENLATDAFIASVEAPAARATYDAQAPMKSIPMGILILETDLTGNPLDSDAAAGGLLDDLTADGFDVAVMDLDPREMISRSERALLRDLKADVRFSGRYDRVIHGTVALESFEQNGDTYTVRVSGSLALSDIERQVTLHRSEISKSSQAASSQQAMSAAFRQLGRTFALELIEQAR